MKPRLPAAPMTSEDSAVWRHFYNRRVMKGGAFEHPYLADCMVADRRDAVLMLSIGLSRQIRTVYVDAEDFDAWLLPGFEYRDANGNFVAARGLGLTYPTSHKRE